MNQFYTLAVKNFCSLFLPDIHFELFTSWLFQIRPIKIIFPTCIKWLIRKIPRRTWFQTLQVAFKMMLAQWTSQQEVITSVSKLSLFRMNFFKYSWWRISGNSAWCSLQNFWIFSEFMLIYFILQYKPIDWLFVLHEFWK